MSTVEPDIFEGDKFREFHELLQLHENIIRGKGGRYAIKGAGLHPASTFVPHSACRLQVVRRLLMALFKYFMPALFLLPKPDGPHCSLN